jgi:nucleoside-diphosphate-sugar epimerase
MKSVSILGCGWLGLALASDLLKKGYAVKGSTTQQTKLEALTTAGIKPYLLDFKPHLIPGDHSDFFNSELLVISIPPRRKSGQTELYLQQLDSIIAHVVMHPLRRVIFISSTSVYAEDNKIVTEEDANRASYAFKAEDKFRSRSEFKTTILRFGGLIGPGRHPGKFFAGKKAIAGGNNPVNIIHQDDCVAIIGRIMTDEIYGETFNACSDNHPTKMHFYTAASKELGLDVPEFVENDESPFKVVSSEKLKRMLNYRFIH